MEKEYSRESALESSGHACKVSEIWTGQVKHGTPSEAITNGSDPLWIDTFHERRAFSRLPNPKGPSNSIVYTFGAPTSTKDLL